MQSLQGRVAVVTGAASGIGRALALDLAGRGMKLALVDVHEERLAEVAEAIEGASVHLVDVADREAMRALPGEVIEAHGGVHLLVNNAGVSCNKPFDEQTLEDWDWLLGINLWGVIHGCHFFLPHLMAAEAAHIVNISSVFGIVGVPTQSSYCTSKFGVRGLSESLWEELQATHVGVTVVHPGGVDTRIVSEGRNWEAVDNEGLFRRFKRQAIPAEAAAKLIVRAVLHDDRRLLITKEAYLMDWLKRLVPVGGNRLVARGLVRALGLIDVEKKRIEEYEKSRGT